MIAGDKLPLSAEKTPSILWTIKNRDGEVLGNFIRDKVDAEAMVATLNTYYPLAGGRAVPTGGDNDKMRALCLMLMFKYAPKEDHAKITAEMEAALGSAAPAESAPAKPPSRGPVLRLENQEKKDKCKQAAQAIIEAFPWRESEEGGDFWSAVYDRLWIVSRGRTGNVVTRDTLPA